MPSASCAPRSTPVMNSPKQPSGSVLRCWRLGFFLGTGLAPSLPTIPLYTLCGKVLRTCSVLHLSHTCSVSHLSRLLRPRRRFAHPLPPCTAVVQEAADLVHQVEEAKRAAAAAGDSGAESELRERVEAIASREV